jgi:hypothetical protein
MSIKSQVGISIAVVSIVFSSLCFALYFAFTPIVLASALVGTIGAGFAFAAKARRTAMIALVFGLVPFAQLLVEQFFDTEYFIFIPAVLAICIAALAIINHSFERRAQLRLTP